MDELYSTHSNHRPYSKLTEDQIYNDYVEYHRRGYSLAQIAERLELPAIRIKQVINLRESRELIDYADNTLANRVKKAKRSDKFKIIDNYRQVLIADYGKTLMDVPNNEPRLLALQLANRTLK